MLALKTDQGLIAWDGGPINGTQHPTNIEQLWTDAELAEWGLYRVVAQPVAAGQIAIGDPQLVQNGDAVTAVYKTEAAPRRLIAKSVILSRVTDAQLDNALGLMTNRQKEEWRAPDRAQIYVDDPALLKVLGAIGADPAVVLS